LPANPANSARWVTNYEGVVWNILGNDASCSDKRPASDRAPCDNSAVRSQGGTLENLRCFEVATSDRRSRVSDIRKYTARPHEYVSIERDAVIKTHVVLNSATVANDNRRRNVHILAQNTIRAEPGSAHDMTEVPDFGVVSDLDGKVNDRRWVNKSIDRNGHDSIMSPSGGSSRELLS
jgi:hypothetical protein